MPNLEYLNLDGCKELEEVSPSLGCCRKLIILDLSDCSKLESLPEEIGYLENLEKLDASLTAISQPPSSIVRLNKLKVLSFEHLPRRARDFGNWESLDARWNKPKFLSFTKEELEVSEVHFVFPPVGEGLRSLESLDFTNCNLIDGLLEDIGCLSSLKVLNLGVNKFEHLPRSIGDLENLEELDASWTAISQPPSSIVRLNKLKILDFAKGEPEVSEVHFVFPPVGEGLRSLESLDLTNCNLIDGGLPEDIGCLSSLKVLNLEGNKFELLPRSIAQLGALRSFYLTRCYNLKELQKFPPDLVKLNAEWEKDSIYNSFAHALFQNLSSKQHDISASDCLSQRVFTIQYKGIDMKVPSWFHYRGIECSVSIDLPENWYIHDNFLGFAVCYCGILVETIVHLLPLCDDVEMSWMTQKLALQKYSKHFTHRYRSQFYVHFFFVPLAGLWDTSKANGKTPNDYGHIRLYFSGEMKKYGLRLLYKNELEGESLSHMKENNDEQANHCIGIRRSRYDNNGEASCSNFKKQR